MTNAAPRPFPRDGGGLVQGKTPLGLAPRLRGGTAEIRETAQQFEAIFLRQMIAAMRTPSLGDDLFGSDASKQFRDMTDARLADSMAGQFGIARLLEKQLTK